MESNESHRDSQGHRDITGDRTMPELAEGLGCGPMSSKIKERRRTAPRKPPFQAGRRRAEPSPNLTSPSASPLATEERGNGASSNSACRRCGWPLSHGGPQDALSQPPDRVVRAPSIETEPQTSGHGRRPPHRRAYSVREVEEASGLSHSSIDRLISSGA